MGRPGKRQIRKVKLQISNPTWIIRPVPIKFSHRIILDRGYICGNNTRQRAQHIQVKHGGHLGIEESCIQRNCPQPPARLAHTAQRPFEAGWDKFQPLNPSVFLVVRNLYPAWFDPVIQSNITPQILVKGAVSNMLLHDKANAHTIS